MPARKKLLPRPCPQCGCEYGGVQIVLFNPRYYWHRSAYVRKTDNRRIGYRLKTRTYEDEFGVHFVYPPYVIVRISHGYSKTERTKNKTRKKIVHNFTSISDWDFPTDRDDIDSRTVKAHQVFRSNLRYLSGITFSLNQRLFENVKSNGWNVFDTSLAHWTRRANLKFCERCGRATKQPQECERCISYYENFRSRRNLLQKSSLPLEQAQN